MARSVRQVHLLKCSCLIPARFDLPVGFTLCSGSCTGRLRFCLCSGVEADIKVSATLKNQVSLSPGSREEAVCRQKYLPRCHSTFNF